MSADAIFGDGFDTYGPTGFFPVRAGVEDPDSTLFASKWTAIYTYSQIAFGNGSTTEDDATVEVVDSLVGLGQALQISNSSIFQGALGISKTLPASYQRIMFGGTFTIPAMLVSERQGVVLGDGASDQICVCFNSSGQIQLRRGTSTDSALLLGTLIATSDESITIGVANTLKADITIHDSAGIAKVWLNDKLTTLNLTGIDTQNTGNATANTVRLVVNKIIDQSDFTNSMVVDHFWMEMFTSGGSGDTVPPASLVVETQFPTSDDSTDFAVGAAILGADYSAVTTTNAPGANKLFLRKFTPEAAGTLDSISTIPAATSVTAKFKAVAYADSSGAPGALLSAGPEVTGCVSGTALTGALTTPQTLVAGTPIWLGFITDTSIVLQETDATLLGRSIANTYGSGAPGTAGAMTINLPSWVIWGDVTGVTALWSVLNQNPYQGDRSYVVSSNVSDQDLFGFSPLSSTPTAIYWVSVEVIYRKSDGGARTVEMRTKSGATTGSGENTGLTPPMSYGSGISYFRVDPDTSAAWNASGVNLAKHGYKIIS